MRKAVRLVDHFGAAPELPGLRRYVVCAPLEGSGPGAAFAWVDGEVADDWLEVDEHPQWDRGGAAVHRIVLFRRLPSLTRAAFSTHWTQQHAQLAARHHPAIVRYVQNVVVGEADLDGVAELGFTSVDDMRHRVYDSDEGKRIIREDVARFAQLRGGTSVDGRYRVLVPAAEG